MAFEKWVKNLASTSGFNPDLVSVSTLNAINVSSLHNAVVVYHAHWSGPSKDGLKLLFETLNRVEHKLEILIIDADELSGKSSTEIVHKARDLFGPVIGGWCECCWIRSGVILAHDILGKKDAGSELIEKRIAEINLEQSSS